MRLVQVVATGVRSAVGLTSATAAAAVRSGIIRASEHPFFVDLYGDPMPAAVDGVIDPGLTGPERFVALAVSAIEEACAPLASWGPTAQVPLYLGLPEIRPGFTEDDAKEIMRRLMQPGTVPVHLSDVLLYTRGHAAGLVAMAHAKEAIESGSEQVVLAGGVDTYFHPDTMEWLDDHRQLASARSRSGFVPGEGAGFCLLANMQTCRSLRTEGLCGIRAASLGNEPKTMKRDVIPLGEGLTSTVLMAVQSLGGSRVNDIICDINGERYRGEEWGFVCLRLAQYFDDISRYRCPSKSWGDVGAASGPMFVALESQATQRGYGRGQRTMIWASSEGGTRAALILENPGS